MRNAVIFENTVYKKPLPQRLFWFCARKQPKLLAMLPKMAWVSLLHLLGIVKRQQYLACRFSFLGKVSDLEQKLCAFWGKRSNRIKPIVNRADPIYISQYPSQALPSMELIANSYDTEKQAFAQFSTLEELCQSAGEQVAVCDKPLSRLNRSGTAFIPVFNLKGYKARKYALAAAACYYLCAAFLALSVIVGTALVSLYYGTAAHGMPLFKSYFEIDWLPLLNILPSIFLFAVCYLLTNRLWLAISASALITFVMSLVSYFKVALRTDPLIAEDFFNIAEGMNMVSNYTIVFTPSMVIGILGIIGASVLAGLLFKERISAPRIRLSLLLALLVLGSLVFRNVYLSETIYEKTNNPTILQNKTDADRYISRGFWYPFLNSFTYVMTPPPEGYDKHEMQNLLKSYQYDNIPEDKKVNVIGIMLEAFSDLRKFESLELERDIYAPFDELCENSVSGSLLTSVFAGGTINTERAFLTGYSSLPQFRSVSNSYVRYFAEQGYTVEGAHPGNAWFYNRASVNANLGFSNYYFKENYFEDKTDSEIVYDWTTFPEILNLYEQGKAQGKPYFSFNVTYQNHGPYRTDKALYEGIVKRGEYSTESYNILTNYLGGIEITIKLIANMVQTLSTQDEPVVLVLFGDHMPWLGNDKAVYNELGVNFDLATEEGIYNHYATPYAIWANDSAKKALDNTFKGDGGDIAPSFLMNKLFSKMGFGGNQYLKFTNEISDTLQYINSNDHSYVENGAFTNELSEQGKELREKYWLMQYYYRTNYITAKENGKR